MDGTYRTLRRSALDYVHENLRCVIARIHTVVEARDLAGFIDQDANAFGVAILGARAGAAGEPERALGIAQQRKIERVFLGESGVLLNAVEARPKHYDILLVKVILLVAEPAALDRSARCTSLGIKPDEHLVPAQVPDRERPALVRRESEIRGVIAPL